MDTEGQWCGFDRYKDEEGNGKIQKEKKKIRVLTQLKSDFPSLPLSPNVGEQDVY